MSLIELTPQEVKRSMAWTGDYYKVEIMDWKDAESKDKKSVNTIPTYKVVEIQGNQSADDYMDRTIGGLGATSFNSQMKERVLMPLLAAIEGITVIELQEKIKETGIKLESKDLIGKRLQIWVEMGDNGSGGLMPKVTRYLPYNDKVPF